MKAKKLLSAIIICAIMMMALPGGYSSNDTAFAEETVSTNIPSNGEVLTIDAVKASVRTNHPKDGKTTIDAGLNASYKGTDETLMRVFPESSVGIQLPPRGWSEYKVYATKEGWYTLDYAVGTVETGAIDVIVNGKVYYGSPHTTGGLDTIANRSIGDIWLPTGWSTIRIKNTASADITFQKLFLHYNAKNTAAQSTQTILYFQNYTRGYAGPYMSSSMGCHDFDGPRWGYYIMINRQGKGSYVTFETAVPKSGWYDVTLGYGLGGSADTSCAIRVNSQNEGLDVTLPATGGYLTIKEPVIGQIYLNKGQNTIRFEDTSDNACYLTYLILNLAEEAVVESDEIVINSKYLDEIQCTRGADVDGDGKWESVFADTYRTYGGNGSHKTGDYLLAHAAISAGPSWFKYTINVPTAGYYNVMAEVGTSASSSWSITLNGEEVDNWSYTATAGNDDVQEQKVGEIYIPAGSNELVITNIHNAVAVGKITLTKDENYSKTKVVDLRIINEDGVRIPYAAVEGTKCCAEVELRHVGAQNTDTAKLIIAEYDVNGRLLNLKCGEINFAELEDGETQSFRTENIVMSESAFSVKGFLLEDDSLAPVAESHIVKDAQLFTAEAVSEIKETDVSYVRATELTATNGNTYYDTGLYTDDYDITPIFYDAYNGQKLFAYIGIPSTATKENPVPAVVCVHGGDGQAYREWVENWNKRGFAAISMDLYGKAPEGEEYSMTYNGVKSNYAQGVVSPWTYAFAYNGDYKQAAMYQNVVNVMYAHNILRSLEEVDSSKIGITGVSWGGVTTTTAIGVDDRFAFAIPIYGCGYLDQGNTAFEEQVPVYNGRIYWDPANFAAKATMPVMYINGNNDASFSVLCSSYTYGITKDAYLTFYHNWNHGQGVAEEDDQGYEFAENVVNGLNPYIKITNTSAAEGVLNVECSIPTGTEISAVKLYYITNSEFPEISGYFQVDWKTLDGYTAVDGGISIDIPEGASMGYAEITDNNGAVICSKFVSLK